MYIFSVWMDCFIDACQSHLIYAVPCLQCFSVSVLPRRCVCVGAYLQLYMPQDLFCEDVLLAMGPRGEEVWWKSRAQLFAFASSWECLLMLPPSSAPDSSFSSLSVWTQHQSRSREHHTSSASLGLLRHLAPRAEQLSSSQPLTRADSISWSA